MYNLNAWASEFIKDAVKVQTQEDGCYLLTLPNGDQYRTKFHKFVFDNTNIPLFVLVNLQGYALSGSRWGNEEMLERYAIYWGEKLRRLSDQLLNDDHDARQRVIQAFINASKMN